MAAEVALLRAADGRVKNVVVEGMHESGEDETQEFGAVVYLMQKTSASWSSPVAF